MTPLDPGFAKTQRNQKAAMLALGLVALVLAALLGLSASGILRFGAQTPPTGQLAAKGMAPNNNILQESGTAPAPVLEKTAEGPPPMPADVEAWLKHLEKCEKAKVEISGDQSAEITVFMQKNSVLGAGMGLMNPYDQSGDGTDDKDPGTYTKGKILDLRPLWQELITYFNSVPPPEECKPLADDFNQAISEIPGMMGDLGEVLNEVSTNPEKALQTVNKMKNGSYDGIDRYFARADQKLGAICAKYARNKWFNIQTDVGAGGMFSKGMLGGIGGAGAIEVPPQLGGGQTTAGAIGQ